MIRSVHSGAASLRVVFQVGSRAGTQVSTLSFATAADALSFLLDLRRSAETLQAVIAQRLPSIKNNLPDRALSASEEGAGGVLSRYAPGLSFIDGTWQRA